MDQAAKTMIENLHKNTGKSLEQWVRIAKRENLEKHGQLVKFLKEKHSFTHGFANLVAHKTLKSDAGSADNQKDLILAQYKGKEHLKPLFNMLMSRIEKFGKDIETAPKKQYVSLRRKKQFAILKPATKTRFEIGLNLKGQKPKGKLEEVKAANSMCSHIINLAGEKEIDKEVIDWIKASYEAAG